MGIFTHSPSMCLHHLSVRKLLHCQQRAELPPRSTLRRVVESAALSDEAVVERSKEHRRKTQAVFFLASQKVIIVKEWSG